LKKENKESQSLFVNLKRRNVKLEEEVKQLKKKLKEKRTQLKKYMFRKETNDDSSITRDKSREGLSKFISKTPCADSMKKKLKFSSTILSNGNKKGISKEELPHKNKSTLHSNVPRTSKVSIHKNDEYCQNKDIQEFIQNSANNFQKAFNNFKRGSRLADRPSILTESGQVEIPEMLLNLNSQRKSRLSGIQTDGRRPSGFKLNNFKDKQQKGKLSSKLMQIKKRNSKLINQQNSKNPFLVNKVWSK
jgi:hypothetical protein